MLSTKKDRRDERRKDNFMEGGRRKGENENPYLSARRTWNAYTASTIASRRMWQAVGIVASLLLLVAVGGIIQISSQSKIVPYIIEVDKLGNAVASGPISQTKTTDPRVIKSAVAEFITDSRLVTPDIALQRAAIFRIYARLTPADPATKKMNDWLNGDPEATPFARARKEMVNIDIKSILPQTADTWQVDWLETSRDRNGGLSEKPVMHRGLVTVYTADPAAGTTEKQLRVNPLGIYVRDFSWQKLL